MKSKNNNLHIIFCVILTTLLYISTYVMANLIHTLPSKPGDLTALEFFTGLITLAIFIAGIVFHVQSVRLVYNRIMDY